MYAHGQIDEAQASKIAEAIDEAVKPPGRMVSSPQGKIYVSPDARFDAVTDGASVSIMEYGSNPSVLINLPFGELQNIVAGLEKATGKMLGTPPSLPDTFGALSSRLRREAAKALDMHDHELAMNLIAAAADAARADRELG